MRSLFGVLLFACLSPFLVKSLRPSLNEDVLGLIVFKADVIDPFGNLNSWNEADENPCKWNGVKCDPRSSRVTELILDDFGLSGKLGISHFQLQFLQRLSLAKNNLTGSLNFSFSQFSDLRILDLSENALSGAISSDLFSQCGSLRSISLAGNSFSGKIPESLGSCSMIVSLNFSSNQFSDVLPLGLGSLLALRTLDLSDNLLDGEIPKGIEALNNLRLISLRKNRFTGEVPDKISNCLLLKFIDFSQNLLSGALPSTMQKLTLCSNLVISQNRFSGDVPDWIGEMRSLEILDMSQNNFTGPIPDSFGNLLSLKNLNLSKNAVMGSLPEAIGNCINLQIFDCSHNFLSGDFPSWLFKLGLQQVLISDNELSGSFDNAVALSTELSRTNLLVLDISQNKLSGEIAPALGDFGSLKFLNMAGNSYLGNIPGNITHLKALSFLDLSENQLNGSIPTMIGDCSSLMYLSLSHNEITGPVPTSLADIYSLQVVDFSYNKLTGALPKQLSNLENLQLFNISHNQLQGDLPAGRFFNTIDPSSTAGNPSLCGSIVNKTCPAVLPKPIVLNPNTTDSTHGTIPQIFGNHKKTLSISALIAISAAVAILIGVIAITFLNFRVRSSKTRSPVTLSFSGDDSTHSSSPDSNSGKLVMFSGGLNLGHVTHSLLSKECELGRGGFGTVYQTKLGSGCPVAIKKLATSSLVKSQEDFEKEVKKLAKVRHSNIVALDGYYWTPSLQLIIYELVSGGNLYRHLHEGVEGCYLNWNERFNIVLGVAKGLAHLHQTGTIHYNLKSSNILINTSCEAKVSDYGLAMLLPTLDRYVLSSKIQSALGYMAPEFACKTVKITEKSDVYGFGVLVLEIVTGRRPVEYMEDDVVVLCEMVRGLLEEGRMDECVDGRMQGKFASDEVIPVMKLGLICAAQVPSNRPDMAEVVEILEEIKCPCRSGDELS